jgi:hypothetical protein
LVTFRAGGGGDFVRRVTRSPRCRANGAAEWELGRESSGGKVLCVIVKYRYRILFVGTR